MRERIQVLDRLTTSEVGDRRSESMTCRRGFEIPFVSFHQGSAFEVEGFGECFFGFGVGRVRTSVQQRAKSPRELSVVVLGRWSFSLRKS